MWSRTIQQLFNDPNHSREAIVTPPGDDPVSARVIVTRGDALSPLFATRSYAPTYTVDLQVADLPTRPSEGTTIMLAAGVAFRVRIAPEFATLVWSCACDLIEAVVSSTSLGPAMLPICCGPVGF